MTTLETAFEVKDEILELLSKEKNLAHLEQIRAYIAALVTGEQKVDWWDELSPEQQADLDLAMEEINDPKNLVSDAEARKMLMKWL